MRPASPNRSTGISPSARPCWPAARSPTPARRRSAPASKPCGAAPLWPLAETQPEFATVALYVAGEERPLADFALDKQHLRSRPVYDVAGPVPQLRLDDLIG